MVESVLQAATLFLRIGFGAILPKQRSFIRFGFGTIVSAKQCSFIRILSSFL